MVRAAGTMIVMRAFNAAEFIVELAAVDEEGTAVILYTSGTTGRPKGAMLSHLGICHSAHHYECCIGLDAQDRAVVAVPMSHVTGKVIKRQLRETLLGGDQSTGDRSNFRALIDVQHCLSRFK